MKSDPLRVHELASLFKHFAVGAPFGDNVAYRHQCFAISISQISESVDLFTQCTEHALMQIFLIFNAAFKAVS